MNALYTVAKKYYILKITNNWFNWSSIYQGMGETLTGSGEEWMGILEASESSSGPKLIYILVGDILRYPLKFNVIDTFLSIHYCNTDT